MSIDFFEVVIILVAGFGAGFINAVAGGGSMLTLPILIFLGLPESMANATNRVAILFGAVSSSSGFRSKGVFVFPYSLYLGLTALAGSIIGAYIALDLDGKLFRQVLSVIMVLVVLHMLFGKKVGVSFIEKMGKRQQIFGMIAFFFVGIYGGLIQVGVGFIIMATLSAINHLPLAKINSIKVFSVLIYTIGAVAIFAFDDKINWLYGLLLAVGNVIGAWISSRWSVDNGDVWVRRILIVMVIAFAVKLSGLFDLIVS